MKKQEQLLKSAYTCITQAELMLDGETTTTIEYQTLNNAATQCLQAAGDLYKLMGMMTLDRKEPTWLKFNDVEIIEVTGRGKIALVSLPMNSHNLTYLTESAVEINESFYVIISIELKRVMFGNNNHRKGDPVGLQIRSATANEIKKIFE